MSDEQRAQQPQTPPPQQVVYYQAPSYDPEEEIGFRELIQIIWDGKWLVAAFVVLGGLFAGTYAYLQPDTYKSEALLAPAESEQQGAVSRLAQQYGGLASMAGIELGDTGANRTEIALAILKSRDFLINFINRHDLRVPLMAAKEWDSQNKEWIIDRNRYNPESGEWVKSEETGQSKRPSDLAAYSAFRNRLKISKEQDTGLITVSLELVSPVAAQEWLAKLINDLNDRMRQRDIAETERTIAYLNEQIKQTSLTDMRQVFFQLVENQIQRQMLAKIREQYALRVVDPPMVPEKSAAPNRKLIIAVGIMLGGMLAIMVIFFRAVLRRPAGA